ncbi:hypothetical protein CHCC16736_4134 [Bacillus licheniformis]|uniref:Uncharacterized protein n=1 Tax=Bacillus licheniformis TaxID=1402 RepID=A0A8B5Y9X7_BACLI|nr:hypothetical protein [Bacillus licheniformis]TWL25251.1 hypothetical protein CHCC16736_4134 [Bacillus licheniformis]
MPTTDKPLSKWNVRDFHSYLKAEHERLYGVPYVPIPTREPWKAEAAGGNRRRLLLNGGIARWHVDCVKNAEKRGKDQIRFVLSKMAYFRQRIGTAQR